MTKTTEKKILNLSDPQWANLLFGPHNQQLDIFERTLDIRLNTRGSQLIMEGSQYALDIVSEVIAQLEVLYRGGHLIKPIDIVNAIRMAELGVLDKFLSMYEEKVVRDYDGKVIRPRTLSQQNYIHAIRKNDMVFGIGPAGTGKTFLAVAMAVAEMKKGKVKRIILTRPAVEAGESLGFLPGDLKEKVDPYLRPLYDALHTLLGAEQLERLLDREIVEIAPLAYMRGRTLEDAFIILDEAQNTTVPQMKMFLTRLGFNSKMVINGDHTQIDLPTGVTSGLRHANKVLKDIPGIEHIKFSSADVIRHPLVASIIDAYETQDK